LKGGYSKVFFDSGLACSIINLLSSMAGILLGSLGATGSYYAISAKKP